MKAFNLVVLFHSEKPLLLCPLGMKNRCNRCH